MIQLVDRQVRRLAVTPQNEAALTAALRAVAGKSTRHTWTDASDLLYAVGDLERRLADLLPASHRPGATAKLWSGGSVPKAYKYSRTVTAVELVRGKRAWYITRIAAYQMWPGSPLTSYLRLTAAQDSIATRRWREARYTV